MFLRKTIERLRTMRHKIYYRVNNSVYIYIYNINNNDGIDMAVKY